MPEVDEVGATAVELDVVGIGVVELVEDCASEVVVVSFPVVILDEVGATDVELDVVVATVAKGVELDVVGAGVLLEVVGIGVVVLVEDGAGEVDELLVEQGFAECVVKIGKTCVVWGSSSQ